MMLRLVDLNSPSDLSINEILTWCHMEQGQHQEGIFFIGDKGKN